MAAVNQELLRIVERQGREPAGIPVLLFTDTTLAAEDAAAGPDVVQQAAAELGYDLEEIALFSTEAYLVQSVAGQLTVQRS